MNLVNDGALVGFWPLTESSGTPLWQNHASAFARYPSGICFDFTAAVADAPNIEEYNSIWIGRGHNINPNSGTIYQGYQVQGSWKLNTDSSPLSRYLVLGHASRICAEQIWQPAVAQSGFTVGLWIYPNSNGFLNFYGSMAASTNSAIEAARAHGLIGAFQAATANAGWRIGISGAMDRGAQFNYDSLAGDQLSAYAFIEKTGTAAPADLLNTPIESGNPTHITYTFRYIDGTNNQIVLYKNGHVAASGITAANLTNTNTSLISTSLGRTLAIGASDDATTATDDYERTSGWNHLVSGAYFFKRVLHEGEILSLHEAGGLQHTPVNLLPIAETKVTDSHLLAYLPHYEPGFADISRHHRPFISNYDLGDHTALVLVPGPYSGCAYFHNGTNTSSYVAASSGLCYDLIASRSWTIGLWFDLQNTNNRDDNMWLSWGSVTTQTSATILPAGSTALTLNTAGLCGTVSGITNAQRAVLEIYPRGDNRNPSDILVFNFNSIYEYYNQSTTHIAIAYDDSTRGIAVYVNGAFAESGTLNHSLTDQLQHITGSGFPLMFGNGITDQVTDATTKGVHAGGGQDIWIGPAFIANRALVGPEIRGIVLSGIANTNTLLRTRHDPRLLGYWPCTDFQTGDILVLDEARCWEQVPGHLVRGDTFASDERWYDRDHNEGAGSVFRNDGTAFIDHFGSRTLPPELASYGNLGITSGVFAASAGSMGTANVADAADVRSSINNLSMRYKPVIEENDLTAQNIAGEFIVSFEVTPSGNIPAISMARVSAANEIDTNCLLFGLGNQSVTPAAGSSDLHAFLTSIYANNPDPAGAEAGLGASGVIIRFDAATGSFSATTHAPLVSGILPFGIPSKILFHSKFDLPNQINGITAGDAIMTISLWINGTLVHRRTTTQLTSRMWAPGTIDSASDNCLLQFGGKIANNTFTTQTDWQGGLGNIYLREIFLMKGIFHQGEVALLAVNGLQSTSIAGYINQKPTTQVTKADSDLQGYWRFHGFAGGGSGTTDLSFQSNHLFPAAERFQQQGGGFTQAAGFLRMVPAMFAQSDLGIQCSGVTYSSRQVTASDPNRISPFMVSGAIFNDPLNGFTVGFIYKKKDDVATTRFDGILAYGVLGGNTVSLTDTNLSRGWIIGVDDTQNLKMIISTGGNLYLDNVSNAAQSGQIVCGAFGEGNNVLDDLRIFEQHFVGNQRVAKLDNWSHNCWTYNPFEGKVKYFQNGELIDSQDIKVAPTDTSISPQWSGLQIPLETHARYLTFLQHTSAPWVFDTVNLNDYDSVITEGFYLSRSLTEEEVRYIALNGIDDAQGTEVSGIIGGFIRGQDVGSGLIGGYTRGLDTVSGLLGGYMPGGTLGSGLIGGYISGIIFADGTVGGFIHGSDVVSGIIAGYIVGANMGSGMIAGYIRGSDTTSGIIGGFVIGSTLASGLIGGFIPASDVGSGLIGGFMLGGLQGRFEFDAGFTVEAVAAEDFDAQLEIAKTTTSDFDAKIIIFQNELPPLVDIIIPSVTVSGLAPPFNQYFIGAASGQQGKTITQVRWNFGDFTPTQTVSVSGNNYYPILHRFTGSGLYNIKFTAIDSDGLRRSAIRIVDAASGIIPVNISLSGVPRSGNAALIVDFDTNIDTIPNGVAIVAQLLDFDDGQFTTSFDPTHTYNEPGIFTPIWIVRDSRNIIWSDSLNSGANN